VLFILLGIVLLEQIMKKISKKRISPRQQGCLFKLIFALALAAVLWILFSPGTGLLSLMRHRAELGRLQEKTAELEKENNDLQKEIDRLQNDPGYLEKVARKEYGLLKKNERVFDFSKNAPARNPRKD